MAVTHGHGNPNWTQDEVILALDLYFDCGTVIPSKSDQRVKDLSALLRTLPYHAVASRKESFRNPDGVAFKLQNIRKVSTGAGLGNVSNTDRQVWNDFGRSPETVKELAAQIRKGITLIKSEDSDSADDDDFLEGRVLTLLHKRRERNSRIRAKLLRSRRANHDLCCEMCGGKSAVSDPAFEDAMFEAHHRVPISASKGERMVTIAEMALVCANCHRLVHRVIAKEKRWVDIDEARTVVGFVTVRLDVSTS